jgi:hypothetical protein
MRGVFPRGALDALPLFPLPGAILMPGTYISLHVFEPRYRMMMEDCIEGFRCLAIAMADEDGFPDEFDRPPIFTVAGAGILRRSAQLPDGRYNIVLEGVARVDVSEELAPTKPYRRARARLLEDVISAGGRLDAAVASLRALASRLVKTLDDQQAEVMEGLTEIEDASQLADLVAAAAIQDNVERQRVLEATDVVRRVEMVAGSLGAMLLDKKGPSPIGWGIGTGEA